MTGVEEIVGEWEARAFYDIGLMIGRYLRENPPPAESRYGVKFAAVGQELADVGRRSLSECGASGLRAMP